MRQPRKPITKTVSVLLSLIMIMGVLSVIPPSLFAAGGVNYIFRSWDGERVVEEVRTCTQYNSISKMTTNDLTEGWHVVDKSRTFSDSLYVRYGTVNLILCDDTTLTDNIGISVAPEATLNIYGQGKGTGKLYIHATYDEQENVGNDAALIGGSSDAGNINIHGGTFDLLMGYNNEERYHGAGIGGAKNCSAKQIKIFGGNIKIVSHGNDGACIGGGSGGMASRYDGEGISIYGGKLDLSSVGGAAIGNGNNCTGSTGSIGIYGGEVTAKSDLGAGIGGGLNGGNGPVNIYGGNVTAASLARECGAGIGGGANASQSAPIRILGGTVVASANKGAGIGGGKNGNGGEIEIASANVITSSTGGGAGIGGGIGGSSSDVYIHSDAVVCSISTTTKSHQAFADLLNMCVGDAKMKPDDTTYSQASVCALSLLIDWFDPEFSGCAIGGGNEGSGGTITIEDSRVYAYCGKRAAVIGGGQNNGFDSITISNSTVYARNKPFEDDEEVISDVDEAAKNRVKKVIDGEDGAAIGTGDEAKSGGGTITIKNFSDVTAIAGTDAAGIGTGNESKVTCNINIRDSKVVARGGRYGAGIGGGDATDSGDITIDYSDITADSATDGAGIGGGEGGKSDTIAITDSTVTATGGSYAAGIGGGDDGDGGTTIIRGSTVRAYGGTDAAGIGGGEDGDGGHIEIKASSNVYAEGKECGAGIGGGEDSSGEYCSIDPNCTVEAVSGGSGNVQSIGHGDCGWDVSYTGGTLSLQPVSLVYAGSGSSNSSLYTGDERYSAVWNNKYAKIVPCEHTESTDYRYDTPGYHVKYCTVCRTRLGSTLEAHIWNSNNVCEVCNASARMFDVSITVRDRNNNEVTQTKQMPIDSMLMLPECESVPDGYEFICWQVDSYSDYLPGEDAWITGDTSIKAVYLPVVETEYIDAEGNLKKVNARRIDTPVNLNISSDSLMLTEGWYVIDSDLEFNHCNIIFTKNVNLIIADGKTLSFDQYEKGRLFEVEYCSIYPTKSYSDAGTFTIYGQTQQTGTIDIGYRYAFIPNLVINGGMLKTERAGDHYGTNRFYNCTINRGQLKGYSVACEEKGITWSENALMMINGGKVDLTSLAVNGKVQLGWSELSDSIKIDEYERGEVFVADDQRLQDESGNIYSGVMTDTQVDAISGKTLTPFVHNYSEPEWVWDSDYTNATAVFRCQDCDDVQEIKAKVTYEDSGKNRTSTARCTYLGEEYTTTQTRQIIFDITIADTTHGNVTVNRASAKMGDNIKLTTAPDEGYVISGLYYTDTSSNKTMVSSTGFIMPESDVTVTAEFAAAQEVEYIDENGKVQTVWAQAVTNDTTELYQGWHYVDGTVTLQDDTTVYYEADLILCDGASLNGRLSSTNLGMSTAMDGTTISVYRAPGENEGRLDLGEICAETVNLIGGRIHLNSRVYGGTLNVNGSSLSIRLIYIHGDFNLTSGSVSAEDSYGWVANVYGDINISGGALFAATGRGTAVTCDGNLMITGGDVEIAGDVSSFKNDKAVRISGGNVTVNGELRALSAFITGGNVSINSKLYAYEDITLGWTNLSDSIYAASYGGAEHIIIADGQELTDGTTHYSGSYDSSQRNLFKEKTLTPNGLLHVDSSEPYIDDTGAYIPGEIEHYEQGGNYFAVNEDGTVGAKLDSVEILYFDFALLSDDTYQIKKYTGPMDDLTRLEIPKTFKGKEITVLGDEESFMNGTGTPCQFTLVLNENIAVIKGSAFAESMLTAVEGDTSGLRQIKDSAFSRANSSDGCAIALNLDYPGVITVDNNAFAYDNITARVTHATTLSSEGRASGIRYIITDDAHTYGDPVWMWENDHSGAAAKITCTDSRCLHEETVKATVTESDETSKIVYTATVVIGGITYTDVQEVNKERYRVLFTDTENGAVSVDKENPYEGEKVTVTVTPDPGYKLSTLAVKDSNNTEIPVADGQFTMPSGDVSVFATFEPNVYDVVYADTEGGWISGVYSANTGDEVELNITPAGGYDFDTLTVMDEDEIEIAVTNNKFTMPAGNVTVSVTFKKKDIAITYETDGNGTVEGAATAKFNDQVPLTVTPDEGYALYNLYALEPEWNDPVEVIDRTLYMIDLPVTVYAEFLPVIPAQAPYIDDNGEYHPGIIEHCEDNGYYYAVENGAVTDQLDSVEVNYFDFKDLGASYQISYYTGPTEDLDTIVIPKSYNGKPVTVLGNDINDAGNVKCRFVPQGTPGFTLVLNENITEIKPYSFYAVQITKVEGDTPNLSKIGNYAFSWSNSRNGYPLDIRLDYPGKITAGNSIFNHMNVTARIKHATTFSRSSLGQQSISYVFTDAHNYSQPKWTWADDYKTATAAFTCTDSRCKHEEAIEATVTSETAGDIVTYTASVQFDDHTYTDTKTADRTFFACHSLTLGGDIGVNFYLDLSDEELSQGVRVDFAWNGKTDFVTFDNNSTAETKAGVEGMYKATCYVCAAEMNDAITASITVGDASDPIAAETYKVRDYANVIIENKDNKFSDELIKLVKSMLNYGASAQKQFDHNTDALANDGVNYDLVKLSDNEISGIAGDVPDKAAINSLLSDSGIEYYGYSLLLKTKTTMRFYFKKNGADTSQLALMNSDNQNVGTVKDYNDDYCYIEVTGIPAYELSDSYVLKYGDISLGSFSALSYVKDVLQNDNGAQPITDTVTALYRYNEAAVTYFNSFA